MKIFDTIEQTNTNQNCLVFEIKDDSMYPKFQNGDRVLVLRTNSVDNGATALVLNKDNETTVKRIEYKAGENWIDLISENPRYKTKRISGADLKEYHIIGEVKMLLREV